MEELYQENAQLVYHFLYKQCHDEKLAEDLTQETFYQAMKSIDRYDYSCKFSVWLCQIAKHLFYQHLRKYGRELPSQDAILEREGAGLLEREVLAKCELMDVLKYMQNLPTQVREVMYLRVMGELSFKEIGEVVGKSENWARVNFYRGKEKLLNWRTEYEK